MLKKNNTIDRMVEILAIFLNEFAYSPLVLIFANIKKRLRGGKNEKIP